ncbi:Uma2 family endonuclease [Allokutzneria sp. A3M-2-11 16]|uniref:Uma2 family endonuclease n=1 Tax=Allokutzneria sp. A3M-2-11 16 TaxID=2962043 RepID=UPI0020B6F3DC|nr:Uma2 family endonuclease [Allokutzneria sp. A3M-2-11 16]MCP3804525.1 Uma2 family endonuclease [Allokutzneria sp. A3M-2-11 16]
MRATPTTVLADWLAQLPDGVTGAEYAQLPEETCRRIEIIDGAVLVRPAPRRSHQAVARGVANLLAANRSVAHSVVTNMDLRLREIPLLNRRPDVVVYDSRPPDDEVLRPEHCLLVVEVVSPDRLDPVAGRYKSAGAHTDRLVTSAPFAVFADLAELG